MISIGSWNIWGLNNLQTQKAVQEWTNKNNLELFGLLETKVAPANLDMVEAKLGLPHWTFMSNISSSTSCRILVGWNPHKISLTCVNVSSQWLTCEITSPSLHIPLRVTFIYGHNTPADRTILWNHLCQESPINAALPWIVLGDFNAIMNAGDRSGGDVNWYHHQNAFSHCIRQTELIPLPYTGLKFTWHNGQQGEHTIQKKLDWIFGNSCLFSSFPAAHSIFMPRLISDHSAMLLHLTNPTFVKPRQSPFKFINAWTDRADFMEIVGTSWDSRITGNPIYQLTTKLCILKSALRKLHHQHTSHIASRVNQAKAAWHAAQIHLDSNPTSTAAKNSERTHAALYMHLCKDEESMLKQRSRINWLQLGDRNTKFFHNSLLHRQVRNRIHGLQDSTGTTIIGQQDMGKLASNYYEQLLSAPQIPLPGPVNYMYPNTISDTSRAAINLPITDEDIKAALFSIPDNKSPGPDGYNAYFFKHCWSIIGPDFLAAVRYFFTNNCLPRCVNATRIALVPKVENPSCMNDFRPISCCNVLYKCISKVIVIRLKAALGDVIGLAQSAFLPGRNISDAILLTQELMHNTHLNTGPSRCALKVDLRKAFDTVRWDFILAGLAAIGIPQHMIQWITICITTAHYTVNLNGELHGFFKATRGIRQGDPLSPYLFVLAMEGLGGIITQATRNTAFKYHWRCATNKITHICFADDLMLYCHADTSSVNILQSCLDKFSTVSGLTINYAKSSIYLSGVDVDTKNRICNQLGFQQGTLPVRYLGVPLISTRLKHADCILLLERLMARIKLWTSSSLTYAGRLQLIKSVLFSIQVYWSSLFILPCSIIAKIEGILSAFLWKGTSMAHVGAKVAWKSICYPLTEGGLGITNLKTWNKAATLKHIWRLLVDKDSLWTIWVTTVLLRNKSFWHVNVPSTASWSWRKILQSREWCRGLFTICIGNGSSTSLWYDYWLPDGQRIIDILPLRTLTSTGLSWTSMVSHIIHNGGWNFPDIPGLQSTWGAINFGPHPDREDQYIWRLHSTGSFTIKSAWEFLREKKPVTTLYHLLWFTSHIPRHSFILWLASLGRLRTMDRLHGELTTTNCILCGLYMETHEHLFFECSYTKSVWTSICHRANQHWPCKPWTQLLHWSAIHYNQRNNNDHMIARLLLSATVYYLWYERNNRVFVSTSQPHHTTVEAIYQQIRTRLAHMNIALSPRTRAIWNLQDD